MAQITKEVTAMKRNLIKVKMYAYLAEHSMEERDLHIQIANAACVTPRQLTYYLDNSSQPSLGELFRIAQVLETTIDKLVE